MVKRVSEGQQSAMQVLVQKGVWQQTTKGKGMVIPRGSASQTAPGISAIEAQHGAHDGDLEPRFPSHLCSGWLPPIPIDHPTQGYTALQTLRKAQPCLMQNSPLVSGLTNRWTPKHLEEHVQPCGTLDVLCSAVGRCRFIRCRDSSNVFGSRYHVREPETQRLQMDFQGFLQSVPKWHTRQLFLQETIMERCPSAKGAQPQALRDQLRHSTGLGEALAEEMAGRLDWAWLHSLLHAQKHGGVARVQLQMGPPNGLLPAQYKACDLIFAQLNGRRRILLLPPSQAFNGLYPYPVHHPYDGYSMVDFEAPDNAKWPAFDANVRGKCCILQPGDLLFVPQFWFVHSQMLDCHNTDLVFDLLPGSRVRHPDAIPLQVSRLLEERMADFEGVANVRFWLSLIGADAEEDYIDPGTVKGYRRVVLCEGVRDEIIANLRPATAAAAVSAVASLLQSIIAERLTQTPWLNQDFREPLYLKDRPVRVADTRSDEERQFPQLFRQKLEGDGWKVPKTLSTVPIPGYNI